MFSSAKRSLCDTCGVPERFWRINEELNMSKSKKGGATFVRVNQTVEPMTGETVTVSMGVVQPVLPAAIPATVGGVPASVAAALAAASAVSADPIGESEAFRMGGELFTAEEGGRAVLVWGRANNILPRGQFDGETDEAYQSYLEKFESDDEKLHDFKRGYAYRHCLRYGAERVTAYIKLSEEKGTCRLATDEEVAAAAAGNGNPALFRVEPWAAYEMPSNTFGKLKGHAGDGNTSEKGAWAIQREWVKNIVDKRYSRAWSDAITLDTFGVGKSRSRGDNLSPGERLGKWTDQACKGIEKASDKRTALWFKSRMREVRTELDEKLAAFRTE